MRSTSHVLPIIDIPYDLNADSIYNSAFCNAASKRLSQQTSADISEALRSALATQASKHVWAIVIEQNQEPVYVLQNTRFTQIPYIYRRVLRVCLPAAPAYLAPLE